MADAKKRNNNNNLPAHPELEQMASSGVEMADVIALRGYVGSKPGDEVVKLYPGLEDMSISVEIPADEILATKEAPLATMPLGGVIVWVSRTADVKFRRTRTVSTTAQEVRKFFGARKAIDPTAPPTPPAGSTGSTFSCRHLPRPTRGSLRFTCRRRTATPAHRATSCVSRNVSSSRPAHETRRPVRRDRRAGSSRRRCS